MKTKTYERKRAVSVQIIDGENARVLCKWKKLSKNASILVVRFKEGDVDHAAECIYNNKCTHKELAVLIAKQMQKIIDAHDGAPCL